MGIKVYRQISDVMYSSVISNKIVCAASAADTGARQDLGIRTAEEGGEEQGGGGA